MSEVLPLLPLRSEVLFPGAVVPVNVGRPRTLRLIDAVATTERLAVATQRSETTDDPTTIADLYAIGVSARVLKIIRLNMGKRVVVLQALDRVRLADAGLGPDPFLHARIEPVPQTPFEDESLRAELVRRVRPAVASPARMFPALRVSALAELEGPSTTEVIDKIAAWMPGGTVERQRILEEPDPRVRAAHVLTLLDAVGSG